MILFYLFLILFFLIIIYDSVFGYARKLIFFIVFFLLVGLQVLRDPSVGTDTESYIMMLNANFDYLTNLSLGYEPLFSAILLIFNYFNIYSNYLYLLILSLLSTGLMVWFIRNKFEQILLPLFSFLSFSMVYFFSFNVMRQSIAISFFFISLFYIEKKYKFYIFLLVASMFHYSAIFLIPVYYIYHSKFAFRTLSFIYIALIYFLHSYLAELFNIITGTNRVLNSLDDDINEKSGLTLVLMYTVMYFIFLFICKHSNQESRFDKLYEVLTIMLLSSSWLMYIFSINYMGIGRISFYFYLALIFYPIVILVRLNKKMQFIFYILYPVLCLIFILLLSNIGSIYGILPYVFSF